MYAYSFFIRNSVLKSVRKFQKKTFNLASRLKAFTKV